MGGWEGGRELKAGSFIRLNRKAAIDVSIEVHKQPHFTCQANTVAGSSLTPSAELLVHPNGTVYSIVNCHKFKASQKLFQRKQTW